MFHAHAGRSKPATRGRFWVAAEVQAFRLYQTKPQFEVLFYPNWFRV
jgi:hypothetical protein